MSNKTKFLLTNPNTEEVTPMVITGITEKGKLTNFELEEGEHIIEIMLSDLEAMDIRLGDTVDFLGEECKGVDLEKRPEDAELFIPPDDEEAVQVKAKKGRSKKV